MASEAKAYIYGKNIPQLFESLMTALMYHKPDDPITFIEQCLAEVRTSNIDNYEWNTFNKLFVNTEDKTSARNGFAASKPLPPIGAAENGQRDSITQQGEENKVASQDVTDQGDVQVQKLAKKSIIFVLGGPGSGKGTQCSKIVQEFGFLHLSAGDLLRQEVAKGTEQGKQLEEIMKQGKLVPAEVTVTLLKDAILSNLEAVGYLIDGFPRELSQGKIFTQQVCEGTMVLMFECNEEVMVGRLVERGKTSGRVDDNEETIRKRLHTYQESTLPVIEHYQQMGRVKKIDAGRSVDEVYTEVQKLFQEITSKPVD